MLHSPQELPLIIPSVDTGKLTITISKLKTDLCWKCQQISNAIIMSSNSTEIEKQQVIQFHLQLDNKNEILLQAISVALEHIERAKTKRQYIIIERCVPSANRKSKKPLVVVMVLLPFQILLYVVAMISQYN